MTPATPSVSRRCAGSPTVVRTLVFFAAVSLATAAEPLRKHFDLPAGSADQLLKQFSEQAGLEVIFSTRIAREVKTNAVKGEMTAREALDAMLTRTALVVIQDRKTGAFTVSRNDPRSQSPPLQPQKKTKLIHPNTKNQ
jgi:iron complex outermembrane recepter protein